MGTPADRRRDPSLECVATNGAFPRKELDSEADSAQGIQSKRPVA